MKLTIKSANETLVQANITIEQMHYILNHLGKTYVDSANREK